MTKKEYSEEFLDKLHSVTGKRAKIVIDHILKHGYITTEELESKYGYNHPPRAARDVREKGIPLETFHVTNSQGRAIAAYRFGDPSESRELTGRKSLPKMLKQRLVELSKNRCFICQTRFDANVLQIDHRIPYEIMGENGDPANQPEEYMLLCGSCNRAKSWFCEHCSNWQGEKDSSICSSCYWACPESYKHVGLRTIRRLDIVWTGKELEEYEKIKQEANGMKELMPDYVKAVLRRHLENR